MNASDRIAGWKRVALVSLLLLQARWSLARLAELAARADAVTA
jgi:hypothetical protein